MVIHLLGKRVNVEARVWFLVLGLIVNTSEGTNQLRLVLLYHLPRLLPCYLSRRNADLLGTCYRGLVDIPLARLRSLT